MWKKITAVTMICILCAFFSFRITDAAEVSGTKQDVTDYKQISALISDTWDDDYFEKMVITPGTDTMEKDGEQEQVSDTFDVSSSKAKSITKSEDVLDNYLDKQDGVYEVKENMDGDLEVTAPYQTKRLIVESNQVKDTCGASEVYVNEMDHETILQYDSEEKTEEAFQQLSRTYSSCYPDKVVSIEDSTMGLPLSQGGENGQGTYSWGSDYMGLNELKKQAASNGYTRRVTVAVVDTGIDTSNVLFAGRKVSSQSYNFFGNNYNVQDTFGHGTHVSGIIADATPANVELLVLRVSNNEGKSSLLTIKTALQYAVSKNADVVNLSMGFIDVNASLYDYLDSTIDKAYNRGIPICCAAGNGEGGSKGVDVRYCYPACYSKTIAVSAIDYSSKQLAYYSNRGSAIDFTAPGSGIVSAYYKGNFATMSGTSMAAPHITAAIAYLKMMQSNLSVDGIYRELKLYCRDLGSKGKDSYYGWGCPIMTNLFQRGISHKRYIVIFRTTLKSVSNVKKGIKVSWKKAYGADSYYVYRRKNKGSWKKVAVVSSSKDFYIDKKVKQGKKYSYKVRAYNGSVFGGFSSVKKAYFLKPLKEVKVRRNTKRKAKVFWKKRTYTTTYQVQYATNARFKKAKKVSVSRKNGSLITKQLKKKVYYFRVRYSYKKAGVKSWSGWSEIRKIRIR